MRSHEKIVKDFGATALGRKLAERGVKIAPNTPQRWVDRNSVPGEYWTALVEVGAASLEELATAAGQKLHAAA